MRRCGGAISPCREPVGLELCGHEHCVALMAPWLLDKMVRLMRREIKGFGTIVPEILSEICEHPTYRIRSRGLLYKHNLNNIASEVARK